MKLLAAAFLLLGLQSTASSVDAVVKRASQYVDTYMKEFGSIIGEEHYGQAAIWEDRDLEGRKISANRTRRMVSDFMTIPVGKEYFGVRHVRQVDDITLDPQYRSFWREAFDETTSDGRDALQKAITFENTRYNIGDFNRSTNMPTFPLEVLDKDNLDLFSFSKSGEEKIGNIQTWRVRFSDRDRGTLLMSTGIGADERYSIRGTLWIEPTTGRVFRAQMELANTLRENIEVKLEVRFRLDAALGVVVPVYMEEHYTDEYANHELDAYADYLNFRRFNTNVKLDTVWHALSGSSDELKKHNDDTYSMKVDVRVVNVDAWVTAASGGGSVTDLAVDDFEVRENDQRQIITNFSPASTPYDVLLLFDRSGSTQNDWVAMQRAAEGFIENLRPQDRAGIANFDTTYRMLTRWTSSREQVKRVVAGLTEGKRPGGTAFYRAVEMSLASELLPVAGRRRALVVLTDGRENSLFNTLFRRGTLLGTRNEPAFQQMIDLAKRERVPIYIISIANNGNEISRLSAFRGPDAAMRYHSAVARRLEQLAEVSGGRVVFPKRLNEIIPLYQQISRELGTAYSIGYVSNIPAEYQGFREIRVSTRDQFLRVVQSRAGYVSQ